MGVTLERVQNKFACIIGELSNEPDIMSQFAIWVDLRIAEYKAKGAIHLDCSGASPNPVWLRGFRPLQCKKPTERNFHLGSPTSTGIPKFERAQTVNVRQSASLDHDNDLWENARASLSSPQGSESPDLMMWDDEPSPHSSQNLIARQQFPANPSQRPAVQTVTGRNLYPRAQSLPDEMFMPTSPKLSKFEPTWKSDHLVNKSPVSVSPGNGKTNPALQPDVSIVLDNAERNTTMPFNTSQTTPQKRPLQPTHPSPAKSAASGSESAASITSPSSTHKGKTRRNTGNSKKSSTTSENIPECLTLKSIRTRILSEGKSDQTIRNIANSVSCLQRYIWKKYGDRRNIEAMSDNHLNTYLVDFFKHAVKSSGEDYGAVPFTNIKSALHRHLSDVGYPFSLKSSVEFAKARAAFQQRRNILLLQKKKKPKKKTKKEEDLSSSEESQSWSDFEKANDEDDDV